MSSYQQCQQCRRRTRGRVRIPMVGEAYRVPACSEHKEIIRLKLAEQATPELRLLAAIFGGVDRIPRPPRVEPPPLLPGTEIPHGMRGKPVQTVETEVL